MAGARQNARLNTKKKLILAIARSFDVLRFTSAEIEQIRRQLISRMGASGKTSADYIISVLEEAGLRVVRSERADTEGRYEEEFKDLLHFSNLEEGEVCLVRLDELLRRFRSQDDRAAVERVLEIARLGRRRAQMIARNPRVENAKRLEKQEVARWFGIWLETPEVFFHWLEIRKQSEEFQSQFAPAADVE